MLDELVKTTRRNIVTRRLSQAHGKRQFVIKINLCL